MIMKHKLKTDSEMFQLVAEGVKQYEIRWNDRDFLEGDMLVLKETVFTGEQMNRGKPLEYTGKEITVQVRHKLQGLYGLELGWCILSFRVVKEGE